MEPVYAAARTVLTPFIGHGLSWTIEGAQLIPRTGPVILASNHVSYLDPLTLAYVADRQGRRTRFLAKAELFDRPVFGWLLRSIRQIPVERGTAEAGDALDAAVDALHQGECVAVFPEGTISLDLDPMPGKSGTARLARRSGVPVLPVGLWGSHRVLTKHRSPQWRLGVPQVAVVGDAVRLAPHDPIRPSTDLIMERVCRCVARARELYPTRPDERDEWWWRPPTSARLRSASPSARAVAESG